MTIAEFRRAIKTHYPHVTIKVKTVSFMDLARCERKCLTVEGEKNSYELGAINALAAMAGILGDTKTVLAPL